MAATRPLLSPPGVGLVRPQCGIDDQTNAHRDQPSTKSNTSRGGGGGGGERGEKGAAASGHEWNRPAGRGGGGEGGGGGGRLRGGRGEREAGCGLGFVRRVGVGAAGSNLRSPRCERGAPPLNHTPGTLSSLGHARTTTGAPLCRPTWATHGAPRRGTGKAFCRFDKSAPGLGQNRSAAGDSGRRVRQPTRAPQLRAGLPRRSEIGWNELDHSCQPAAGSSRSRASPVELRTNHPTRPFPSTANQYRVAETFDFLISRMTSWSLRAARSRSATVEQTVPVGDRTLGVHRVGAHRHHRRVDGLEVTEPVAQPGQPPVQTPLNANGYKSQDGLPPGDVEKQMSWPDWSSGG